MEPEAGSREFVVTHLHPGVTREKVAENTGWAVRFAGGLVETEPPSEPELTTLRTLLQRTAEAHAKM
jgi:glutaconate CoA-transferase subunit B